MRLSNAIYNGKNRLFFCVGPNCGNIFIGQPTIPMISSIIVAAFFGCIRIVFSLCSQLKMIGIYTWRVVAFVHDDLAIRYFSNIKFVSVAMRSNSFASGNHKNPVPIGIFPANPMPTIFRFLDFCFKGLMFCNAEMLIQGLRIPGLFVMFAAQLTRHGWLKTKRTWNNFVYLMAHKSSGKNPIIFHFDGGYNVL